jgi:hypothetical protein
MPVSASSLLFGTFKEADGAFGLEVGKEGGPIDPNESFDASSFVSGHAAMAPPNYGTDGGAVRYRWIGNLWKPFFRNPQAQMYTPTPSGSFPWAWSAIVKTPATKAASDPVFGFKAQSRPTTFTPAPAAQIYAFADDQVG